MAIKQAKTVGVATEFYDFKLNCSLIKEDLVDEAFYSTSENPLYWNDKATSTIGLEIFETVGDNIDSFIGLDMEAYPRSYHYQTSPHAYYIYLGSLPQNFFCLHLLITGTNLFDYNFCVASEPKTGVSTILDLQSTKGKMKRGASHYHAYLAILIDDAKQEMQFVYYSFYINNQCHCHGLLNENERKQAYKQLRDYVDIPSTDPWISGGASTVGGGGGNLNIHSDTITNGLLPTSAISTGFVQAFAPSLSQIKELSSYMWSDSFLNNLIRLWDNPMDIIISLTQYPFFIPSTSNGVVQAGNVTTGISMRVPDSQFITLDCGSLNVDRFYNAYVDFEPYTTCQIFLPYIGSHTLSMDDISGKTLNVKYTFDILSGTCVANIFVDGSIMYTFSGNCGVTIPITSQSYSAVVENSLNVGLSTLGGSGGFTSVVTNVTGAVMSAKPTIERSGSIGSYGGLFTPQKPYLTFSIPRICLPKNQNTFIGYPSYIETALNKLEGFTRVFDVRLSGIDCTETEYNEILQLLKGGVII